MYFIEPAVPVAPKPGVVPQAPAAPTPGGPAPPLATSAGVTPGFFFGFLVFTLYNITTAYIKMKK